MRKDLSKEDKNRLYLVIIGIALFTIAVIIGIILAIRSAIYSAKIIINVAPGDATILIDDKQYKNGVVALKPGDHHAEISLDGFESKVIDFNAKKNSEYKLYTCLNTTEETADWYDQHKDDYTLCNIANEYLLRVAQAEQLSDPIFKITPYHSYDKGYNIDPYFDENNKTVIKITALSCDVERRKSLYQFAIEYLEGKGIKTNDYKIERASNC